MTTKLPAYPNAGRWLLAGGLAFVFAYAGFQALRTPDNWIGYVPSMVTHIMSASTFLQLISISQLVLAVWLLSGYWRRLAGVAAILLLGGIIVGNPHALDITFRDVGLLFVAGALVLGV